MSYSKILGPYSDGHANAEKYFKFVKPVDSAPTPNVPTEETVLTNNL